MEFVSPTDGTIAFKSTLSYHNGSTWAEIANIENFNPAERTLDNVEVKVWGKRLVKNLAGYGKLSEATATLVYEKTKSAAISALFGDTKSWRLQIVDMSKDPEVTDTLYWNGYMSKDGIEMGEGDALVKQNIAIMSETEITTSDPTESSSSSSGA